MTGAMQALASLHALMLSGLTGSLSTNLLQGGGITGFLAEPGLQSEATH